ncbi:Uncharacterized protein BCINRASA_02617 [Bacillus wiedmannii]|nr:Uncharacterized protein BCINRASA_02617 [Bacillus wiedmannii]
MELKEYMNETFPGVTLVPHIYFQWGNYLHFHFGKGKCPNVQMSKEPMI